MHRKSITKVIEILSSAQRWVPYLHFFVLTFLVYPLTLTVLGLHHPLAGFIFRVLGFALCTLSMTLLSGSCTDVSARYHPGAGWLAA